MSATARSLSCNAEGTGAAELAESADDADVLEGPLLAQDMGFRAELEVARAEALTGVSCLQTKNSLRR